MNYSMIRYMIGWILMIGAIFLMIPAAISFAMSDGAGVSFLLVIIVSALIGYVSTRKKPENSNFYAREGFVTVSLCWIFLSIAGALPFFLSGYIPSFTDALFEVISGFTTTGASILPDVEALPKSLLLWRSFTHWLGGMGVLVFLLAFLPIAGGQSILLMKAESPGPSVGKLVPKLQQTAFYLYGIYLVMTVIEIILLTFGDLDFFSAVCLSFGTAGTGGFGVLGDSFASYSSYTQIVVTIFMIAFGVNFNFYFLLIMKKGSAALAMEEVRWYLGIYLAAVVLITVNLLSVSYGGLGYCLKHVAFTCASIMTTTGYATVDFDLWPEFSKTLLVFMMFIGACAGSTGGGMKVSRIMLYLRAVGKELHSLIHPRSVRVLHMDKKMVDKTVLSTAKMFFICYAVIYVASMLIISLDNFDFTTNFTAVAATLNNIGPGLAAVGPTRNFAAFSGLSKYVLMFDMLAGRLELFPMLVLFYPATWRR